MYFTNRSDNNNKTKILILFCIKVVFSIDSNSFYRSIFCLRSSIFPLLDYKIDLVKTKICNDAYYGGNYQLPYTNEYRLGVITGSTRIYSMYVSSVTQQQNTGVGGGGNFQTTTPFNQGGQGGNTPFNPNQGTTRFPNNNPNQGQGGNVPNNPNNNQGTTSGRFPNNQNNFQSQGGNTNPNNPSQGGNFQGQGGNNQGQGGQARGPFRISTSSTTESLVELEFDPSDNPFDDYDEVDPYAAPRQKSTEVPFLSTTTRDTEPLEFAAELLPVEKLIEENNQTTTRTVQVTQVTHIELVEIENVS